LRVNFFRLPDVDAVYEGVIVTKIAAHAADVARGIPGAIDWDNAMSKARYDLDWKKQIELAIDSERAKKIRDASQPTDEDVCTMCGEYCALKAIREALPKK